MKTCGCEACRAFSQRLSQMEIGPDFRVRDEGTIVGLEPLNDNARAWLLDAVTEGAAGRLIARVLWGDHRPMQELIAALEAEGFTFTGGH